MKNRKRRTEDWGRRLRRAAAALALLGSGGLVALLVLSAARIPTDMPATWRDGASLPVIHGVRSSVVRDGRMAARITADTIEVTRPRVLGPFRVGFLRAVAAHGVTVETFEDANHPAQEPGLTASDASLLAGLSPGLQTQLVHTSAEGVRLIRHRRGGDALRLEAHSCESTTRGQLRCRAGVLRDDKHRAPFREAVHDGRTWILDGRAADLWSQDDSL